MDTCTRCGRDGHCASSCKQPLPDLRRNIAVLLAGFLIVGPAPAIPHLQAPAEPLVNLPVPISIARACNADPEGCRLLPEAEYQQRMAAVFQLGRHARCGSAL